jgi:hypothetical protein
MTYIKTAFDFVFAVICTNAAAHCVGLSTPVDSGGVALAMAVVALLRINGEKKAP